MNYGKLQLGLNRNEAAAAAAGRAASASHAAAVCESLQSEVCVALNQVRRVALHRDQAGLGFSSLRGESWGKPTEVCPIFIFHITNWTANLDYMKQQHQEQQQVVQLHYWELLTVRTGS